MNYYVAQVKTGMEEKFVLADKKINAGDNRKYSIIFPQRVLKIRRNGKYSFEKAPVFKGYIFIETEVSEPREFNTKVYKPLKIIRGFYHFLPDNENPKALYGRDLEILNYFKNFGGVAGISQVSFDENDRIQILRGPLKGLEGEIIKVNKRKGRAKVILDAYSHSFSIDLSFEVLDLSKKGGANVGTSE